MTVGAALDASGPRRGRGRPKGTGKVDPADIVDAALGVLPALLADRGEGSPARLEYIAQRFTATLVEPSARLRSLEADGIERSFDEVTPPDPNHQAGCSQSSYDPDRIEYQAPNKPIGSTVDHETCAPIDVCTPSDDRPYGRRFHPPAVLSIVPAPR